MEKQKIGFFFGAGAEVCYGLPSGAEFAGMLLDCSEKETYKTAKENFEKFTGKKYGSFSKISSEDFQKITESMVRNKEKELIKLFLDSDKEFEDNHRERQPVSIFQASLENSYSLSDFPKFYLISEVIKQNKTKEPDEKDSSNIDLLVKFNLSIVFFLFGKHFLRNVNKEIFTEDVLSSFEGAADFFSLEKQKAPRISGELFGILKEYNDKKEKNPFFYELAFFTKSLLNKCIDYQFLFEKFDSLFYPDRNKSQFLRIASLLFVMRQIIDQQTVKCKKLPENKTGSYYEDITSGKYVTPDDTVVCTTNYSPFCEIFFGKRNVFYLNGKTDCFFDISGKRIVENISEPLKDKLLVPFIFPQVDMKPIMYFDVVKKYALAYESLRNCSKIIVLGFGFQKDDNLLNGMFRNLLEDNKDLRIVYFHYISDENIKDACEKKKNELIERLCISDEAKKERFLVLPITGSRMSNGKNWLEQLQ